MSAVRKPVIGLVGGIGSGKSRVGALLASRGGLLIPADELAHQALRVPEIRERVTARFGRQILGEQGEIVRGRLAEVVFRDDQARRDLENLLFPWIEQRTIEAIVAVGADPGVKFVVLDAAVLLEAGWRRMCDRVIFVSASDEVRRDRVVARGWTEEQWQARERAQWPLAAKLAQSDASIENSGPVAETARQLDALLKRWNLVPEPSERPLD